ncbi:hypothetical protein BafPKo_0434 [Borreliella afzelii PKo]|uniref:Uncharacterized protein n=1 Tax=Borreliella afzelii (strain PKo) TaxID=390236 RepID=G0IS68_BORAP|nr:hypothetical protein BafPKo_0434 [Borreliella afzelii PKo]
MTVYNLKSITYCRFGGFVPTPNQQDINSTTSETSKDIN